MAFLTGVADDQPRRVIELVARTREQARLAYEFACALIKSLPMEQQGLITALKPPRLEIRLENEDGPHYLRVISSDGKSNLGSSPVFALGDERGHWAPKGDDVEGAILTALAKRGGRYCMISTSAPDDQHEFSKWLDNPPEGSYTQEHKAPDGLPLDDEAALLAANPGCKHGVGPSLKDLKKAARRAIQRGGFAEQQFRLYTLNQRVPTDDRALVLTVDQFTKCEVSELPPRSGPVVIGLDSGESQSMCAACYYWYETGRMETHGWFPGEPSLLDRGAADRVANRYEEMRQRGELSTLGQLTIPIAQWVQEVVGRVHGSPVQCFVADRFKQSQFEEGVRQAGLHVPIVYRRNGWYDGGEDINRFRNAVLDGEVKTLPSLLLRSAVADAVVQRDDAGNCRLSKSKSVSRIDALSASVIAIAEGQRLAAQPKAKAPRVQWA
jgi:phage terminase large subunit-like protein